MFETLIKDQDEGVFGSSNKNTSTSKLDYDSLNIDGVLNDLDSAVKSARRYESIKDALVYSTNSSKQVQTQNQSLNICGCFS